VRSAVFDVRSPTGCPPTVGLSVLIAGGMGGVVIASGAWA